MEEYTDKKNTNETEAVLLVKSRWFLSLDKHFDRINSLNSPHLSYLINMDPSQVGALI